MKKFLLGAVTVLVIAFLIVQTGVLTGYDWNDLWGGVSPTPTANTLNPLTYAQSGDIRYRVKAEGNYFYFYNKGKWEKQFMKGVNIGAGKPGIFPGELTTSYEEYYRWFEYISEMNANCIRVYTTLRPQFYNALLDFNKQAENPLYIFQGVWMDEADVQSLSDVYAQNNQILNEFMQDALNVVDVIHGNATLPVRAGYASGSYTADVSQYLAGWIIGIEWDPKLVKTTNESNTDRNVYDGVYLYTLSATPFEAFLCQVGDKVIVHETEQYHFQAPLAFSNWMTTDPLTHLNEPHSDEDLVTVNMENIKGRDKYYAKEFICYHIYPYYPDSLNYQEDYITYKDSTGKINPYRAYLKDLKLVHTMPIIIAEFGIPTSRGLTHKSIMGYNQGQVDETDQGEMLLDMLNSMYQENYAGGIVFTWQDEWFKRTWNNVKFDIADRRPFWSNIQTSEQNFGLLAFDPGTDDCICYIDGDLSDWSEDTPLIINNTGSLYVKSDERYVYLRMDLDNFDFTKDTLYIPIDTIAGQGNLTYKDQSVTFDKMADFVVVVNGKDNTRILVDSYYDSFYYLYGEQYSMITKVSDIRTKNSGRFNTMQMCYNYEMTIPPEGTIIPFQSYETGKLTYGISNPSSKDYQSLADFYVKDNTIELRIPWQLLNVMDPSTNQIMDDLYTMQNIVATDDSGFTFGLGIKKSDEKSAAVDLTATYTWDNWILPTYHERLKPAYYVLQNGLKSLK